VIRAFDINTVANAVYQENFGIKPLTTNVEHLPLQYYEKMAADVWLMSPPCQPFTRGGLKQDAKDARSTGFLYILSVLEEMGNPPSYLFLENVLNFETSECHEGLVRVLTERGYEIEEYLVAPTDLWVGIPNGRLRYYMAAKRPANRPARPYTGIIYKYFEEVLGPVPEGSRLRTIGEFLQLDGDEDQYLVPMHYLTEYKNYRHDITWPASTRSTTFTKSYGSKYIIGTGSFLQTKNLELDYKTDDREALVTLGLRFFTPMEIAQLHGLPTAEGMRVFCFAPQTTKAQQYKLLGNSLNIKVVSLILKRLFTANDN